MKIPEFARWRAFWKKHDPDEVFSYNTFKMVTIRDRYLGLLHHVLQLGLFIYIIVYVIVVSRGFLDKQATVGFVRIGAINTAIPSVDPSMAGVCANYTCIYPVVDQITDVSGSGLFITTHLNITEYAANCDFTDPLCDSTVVSGPDDYYVANLNNLMITLDHSSQLSFGNQAPIGYLQTVADSSSSGITWRTCSECPVNEFQSLAADFIPLSTILLAAQLDLSDEATGYLQGTDEYYYADYRTYGAIILLSVSYDNIANYYTGDPPILYYYQPELITSVDDYFIESMYSSYPNNRTVLYNKGIRIMAVLAGQLGTFSFQTLLIQLTTSITLMKIAATIVDLVAIHFLPHKRLYKEAKFEQTKDFSNIRKDKRLSKSQSGASLEAPEIELNEETMGGDDTGADNSITYNKESNFK